jgi:large subunit ribosomal protein L4e
MLVECVYLWKVLVLGHLIQDVPELPLVVDDKVQEYSKTKQAVIFLRRIKAWADIQKVRFIMCCG